jgi:hypothetical protein
MANKAKQKDAVLAAIFTVLGGKPEEGEKVELSKEQRGKVIDILFNGFKAGEIELGVTYGDSDLKSYTSSLLNNWLRKAKELNGGETYKAKNPGSRAGQTDTVLKNLRVLLKAKQTANADQSIIDQIQQAIDLRLGEIKAAKKPQVDIDVSALPEALRHLVGESASA